MSGSRQEGEGQPLVYACSGASNLGQLAHDVAVRLDRAGLAEMSCAEAVAIEADPPFAAARSGRPVIAVSGCPLACAERLLSEHGVGVSSSISLVERGVAKAKHVSVAPDDGERIFREVLDDLEPLLVPVGA